MKRILVVVAVPTLAVVGTGWSAPIPFAQTSQGCGVSQPPSSSAAHAYFQALISRADCWKAYSLRDNAQLAQFSNSKSKPQRVTYLPEKDSDPRRQDAAKLVLAAGKVSLGNTVRLPIGTSDGTSTLITWDAWFGSEFRVENTGIGGYKTFQFASPADRIWFEVRTRLKLDEARQAKKAVRVPKSRRTASTGQSQGPTTSGSPGDPPTQRPSQSSPMSAPAPRASASAERAGSRLALGVVDARGYGARGTVLGPNVQRGSPLSPQVGTFTIYAETWTRYWVLIEQRADDWDLISLWVADEDHDPVLLIDHLQFNVKKSVDQFWLEYNTSAKLPDRLGERVAYARNVVMLRNVSDAKALLQRPVK